MFPYFGGTISFVGGGLNVLTRGACTLTTHRVGDGSLVVGAFLYDRSFGQHTSTDRVWTMIILYLSIITAVVLTDLGTTALTA